MQGNLSGFSERAVNPSEGGMGARGWKQPGGTVIFSVGSAGPGREHLLVTRCLKWELLSANVLSKIWI